MTFNICFKRVQCLANRISLFILPPFCTYCRSSLQGRYALCQGCLSLIQPMGSKPVELTTTGRMMVVHCVGRYHGPLQKLILAKGRSDKLACWYMAQLMMQRGLLEQMSFDYIVFVPLHWTRYAKRGYNQAEEIARYLAQEAQVPLLHALKRVKRTPLQSTFDQEGRRKNVHQAFICSLTDKQRAEFKGKKILLVDDVMTTGSTLRSAARTLLACKPAQVQAIVLART